MGVSAAAKQQVKSACHAMRLIIRRRAANLQKAALCRAALHAWLLIFRQLEDARQHGRLRTVRIALELVSRVQASFRAARISVRLTSVSCTSLKSPA